jgi:electron transfer flavoprotein beta subunit
VVASKRKEVQTLTGAELGLDDGELGERGSGTRVLGVGRPPARTPGVLIEDDEQAPERLVELLAERGLL